MRLISIKENPEYKNSGIKYFQEKWATPESMDVYSNSISSCLSSQSPIPQWYLLFDEEKIVGCAGLITNDFISRMDLYPWICALFIEKEYRGKNFGNLILKKAEEDAKKTGFPFVYLCTDHVGYYEKFGYKYIADGYHPWGESSRIYEKQL